MATIVALSAVALTSCGRSGSSGLAVARTNGVQAPGMLYVGPGIDLVGTSPLRTPGPPRLYRSTDGVHWSDVTPPAAEQRGHFAFPVFAQATFINTRDGYVSACDQPDTRSYLYETDNGGESWSTVAFGGCSHGISNIQLVTSNFAVASGRCSGIPCAPVTTSTDGFRTSTAPLTFGVLDEPPPPTADPLPPVTFATPDEGFTASLISSEAGDDGWTKTAFFASTHDGGRSWQQGTPPTAGPQSIYYGLPTFATPEDGVLPTISGPAASRVLTFDATSDGGRSWQIKRTLPTAGDPSLNQITIDVATTAIWWVISVSNGDRPQVDVTSDAGAHWNSTNPTTLPSTASQLGATNSTAALVLTATPASPSASAADELQRTEDGGRTWQHIELPPG